MHLDDLQKVLQKLNQILTHLTILIKRKKAFHQLIFTIKQSTIRETLQMKEDLVEVVIPIITTIHPSDILLQNPLRKSVNPPPKVEVVVVPILNLSSNNNFLQIQRITITRLLSIRLLVWYMSKWSIVWEERRIRYRSNYILRRIRDYWLRMRMSRWGGSYWSRRGSWEKWGTLRRWWLRKELIWKRNIYKNLNLSPSITLPSSKRSPPSSRLSTK